MKDYLGVIIFFVTMPLLIAKVKKNSDVLVNFQSKNYAIYLNSVYSLAAIRNEFKIAEDWVC